MTHTDLSAEEPSERAATGPQLFEVGLRAEVNGPKGIGVKAQGKVQAPAGGPIEIAVATVIVFAGGVLVPASAAAILATTGMAGWVVATIVAGVLVAYGATATIVVTRKGLFTR